MVDKQKPPQLSAAEAQAFLAQYKTEFHQLSTQMDTLEDSYNSVARKGEPLRYQIEVLQRQWDRDYGIRLRTIGNELAPLRDKRNRMHQSSDARLAEKIMDEEALRQRQRAIFELAKPALVGRADDLVRSGIEMGAYLGNVVKAALADETIIGQGYSLLEDEASEVKHNHRILVGNRVAGEGVRLILFRTGDIAVAYYPEDTRENGARIIDADDILTGIPSAPNEVDECVTTILGTGEISFRVDGKRVTIPNPNNH